MMPVRTSRPTTLLFAALAALLFAPVLPAAAQQLEGSFDRTLTVTGTVELKVQSGSGTIRIQPGAAGSVRVAARLKSGGSWTSSGSDIEQRIRRIEQNPPVAQQGNAITIGHFDDQDLARNISISYDVTVPADASVTAGTGSGGIVVGTLTGPVVVNTGSGSVQVDGAARLKAHTGSGSIKAAGIAGPASASTGSGSITMAQTGPGEVSASSGSGTIRLTGVNGAATVSASSGRITIDGRLAGPWSINSSSGSVTVTLPPDAAFDLDARSSSGSVSTAHPVTMTGELNKRRMAGTVRGGGPLLKISCSSGSVTIK